MRLRLSGGKLRYKMRDYDCLEVSLDIKWEKITLKDCLEVSLDIKWEIKTVWR